MLVMMQGPDRIESRGDGRLVCFGKDFLGKGLWLLWWDRKIKRVQDFRGVGGRYDGRTTRVGTSFCTPCWRPGVILWWHLLKA